MKYGYCSRQMSKKWQNNNAVKENQVLHWTSCFILRVATRYWDYIIVEIAGDNSSCATLNSSLILEKILCLEDGHLKLCSPSNSDEYVLSLPRTCASDVNPSNREYWSAEFKYFKDSENFVKARICIRSSEQTDDYHNISGEPWHDELN